MSALLPESSNRVQKDCKVKKSVQYDIQVNSPNLDRFLRGPERVLWAADQVAPLNFAVVVALEGPLTVGALRVGLAAAQRRHGALRCAVCSVEGRPRFVPTTEPIPLSLIAGASWTAHLMGELDTPFDVSRHRRVMHRTTVAGIGPTVDANGGILHRA